MQKDTVFCKKKNYLCLCQLPVGKGMIQIVRCVKWFWSLNCDTSLYIVALCNIYLIPYLCHSVLLSTTCIVFCFFWTADMYSCWLIYCMIMVPIKCYYVYWLYMVFVFFYTSRCFARFLFIMSVATHLPNHTWRMYVQLGARSKTFLVTFGSNVKSRNTLKQNFEKRMYKSWSEIQFFHWKLIWKKNTPNTLQQNVLVSKSLQNVLQNLMCLS